MMRTLWSPPSPDEVCSHSSNSEGEHSRYVPVAVRDEVFEKAGHRCEYVAADGTRCSARTGLTIDHRQPFAREGTHNASNLRVLCGPHNQLYAVECYGKDFIEGKIAERARSANSVREPRARYGPPRSSPRTSARNSPRLTTTPRRNDQLRGLAVLTADQIEDELGDG